MLWIIVRRLPIFPAASTALSVWSNNANYLARTFSTTTHLRKMTIQEVSEGNTTTVEVLEERPPTDKRPDLINLRDPHQACSLCRLGVNVAYSDVLILEQFMREDGTVLPSRLTGLCKKQQLRVERCVMQAHWAGLFPDKTSPGFNPNEGYKQFERYWESDVDMYKLKHTVITGSHYYIKRYDVGRGRPYPKIPKA